MKRRIRFSMILIVVPFIIGTFGYLQIFENDLSAAAYSALRLYGLDLVVGESEVNIWIEAARWLAAAVTVSAILQVLSRFVTDFRIWMRLRNEDIIVVHGDGLQKEMMLNSIDAPAIEMCSPKCFAAKKHVLAFDTDDAAVRYLQENEDVLLEKNGEGMSEDRRKSIYFCSEDYEPSDYEQTGLIISNTAVNCARQYWNANWIGAENIGKDAKKIERYKVAIIGFGRYGQRVLEQAIMMNVSTLLGQVEYHVFGSDGKEFCNWHYMLKSIVAFNRYDDEKDSIYFYPTLAGQEIDILNHMDRVIITMDEMEDSVLCLDKLIKAGIGADFHVRCNDNLLKRFRYMPVDKNNIYTIRAFGEDKLLYTNEVIIHGQLNDAAVNAHITYVSNSKAARISGKYESCAKRGCPKLAKRSDDTASEVYCGDCPYARGTWDDLSPFIKASNIALADHNPVKRHMVSCFANGTISRQEQIDLYAIEHMRWCRFHYLHNWRQGTGKGRYHQSLVSFGDLSTGDKEYCELEYRKLYEEMNVRFEPVKYDAQ